jgi:hypothetical protein
MRIGIDTRSTWRKSACSDAILSAAVTYRLSPNIFVNSEAVLNIFLATMLLSKCAYRNLLNQTSKLYSLVGTISFRINFYFLIKKVLYLELDNYTKYITLLTFSISR